MIDPLDPDVEVLPMSNSLHAALSGIWPDLTKADRQRVAEAVTQEQAAVIRELRADLERAEAEADRLREAIRQHYREKVGVPDDEDVALWNVAGIREEENDGLTEVARISEDADLYRKTDGVILRRREEACEACGDGPRPPFHPSVYHPSVYTEGDPPPTS